MWYIRAEISDMTESIVNANKEKILLERMAKLGIRAAELREDFIRGS
jgi:hypothetical protein